jgi:DNA-binding MarR family transcriptional regulator
MTLPLAQSRVLRFVADTGPATARQVTKALRMGRGDVQNALRLLDGKGLVTLADLCAWPAS